ncbi:xanthine dehydrogenase small subunit [Pedococcus dokdonensis]|uniref:Xanthine dehydrogenase small subunit n=1 Tax=Pedococcus dokdonensis TaxID=443156 RepID=A0A1H0UMS1_9MICO|nr:FAD binding domain-containing protein [Pedococcus dokdonensis]SDP67248.1 xanthine dehydrogenase small subunit [Pedococcus dokdonensis]
MVSDSTQAVVEHSITVNGATRALDGTDPSTTTLDWLRSQGLTGAKEGCAEGECGACSIMVARPTEGAGTQWTAINACLVPAAALDGQEVVTSEGLGRPDALHPVQHEMAVRGGSQCGYCTPGFICSMAAEYYREGRCSKPGAAPDPEQNGHEPAATANDPGNAPDHEHGPNGFDLHALSGNLCRCTGYRPIRDAAYALGEPAEDDPYAARLAAAPPAARATRIDGTTGTYARPGDLTEALALLAEHPDAVLVAGSTDWGVEVNIRGVRTPFAIGIDRLPELRTLDVGDDVVEIGAALSLSEVERALAGRIPLLDKMFPQFASRLIRNGATIGGNLGTGSPIGDTPPALLALEAVVVLASADGDREVPLADYFTGYRQTVKREGELIRAVRIPLPLSELTAFHKIAKRRFDDISSVAVGFALDVREGVVSKARIGLGGVAATPIRALATEAALEGRPWSAEVVREAAAVMRAEGTPLDDHRASAAYRTATLGTALLKLYAETATAQEVGA